VIAFIQQYEANATYSQTMMFDAKWANITTNQVRVWCVVSSVVDTHLCTQQLNVIAIEPYTGNVPAPAPV
jgi:hypothetical protein